MFIEVTSKSGKKVRVNILNIDIIFESRTQEGIVEIGLTSSPDETVSIRESYADVNKLIDNEVRRMYPK